MTDIQRGIDLFNDADFFSAHDFFEDLWIDSEKDDRLFFQGMVQVSVGCYHFICKNYKGSLSQFNKASEKLKQYPPVYNDVNLEKLLIEIEPLKKIIIKKNETVKISLDQMPKIDYKKLLNNK